MNRLLTVAVALVLLTPHGWAPPPPEPGPARGEAKSAKAFAGLKGRVVAVFDCRFSWPQVGQSLEPLNKHVASIHLFAGDRGAAGPAARTQA